MRVSIKCHGRRAGAQSICEAVCVLAPVALPLDAPAAVANRVRLRQPPASGEAKALPV